MNNMSYRIEKTETHHLLVVNENGTERICLSIQHPSFTENETEWAQLEHTVGIWHENMQDLGYVNHIKESE